MRKFFRYASFIVLGILLGDLISFTFRSLFPKPLKERRVQDVRYTLGRFPFLLFDERIRKITNEVYTDSVKNNTSLEAMGTSLSELRDLVKTTDRMELAREFHRLEGGINWKNLRYLPNRIVKMDFSIQELNLIQKPEIENVWGSYSLKSTKETIKRLDLEPHEVATANRRLEKLTKRHHHNLLVMCVDAITTNNIVPSDEWDTVNGLVGTWELDLQKDMGVSSNELHQLFLQRRAKYQK